MSDFKKFDTQATTNYWNVRLAKDASVKEFGENTFAEFTFVDSSRLDGDEEMWVSVNPTKRNSVLASYLEKGDVVGASGKLTFRRWGENNDKIAFNLRNAELHIEPGLLATLKERGWVPGSEEMKGAEAIAPKVTTGKKRGRPPGSGKAAAPVKGKAKPIPVEIDLDDDDAEEDVED
jgi:single-stranded DNA-binding protein